MRARYYLLVFLISAFSLGCKSTQPDAALQLVEAPAGFTVIGDSLDPDPAVEALIEPFRQRLTEATSEVIGNAEVLLQKGGLESGLGNMAADAMLIVARDRYDTSIDMALTNNGGLRVSIAPGPITVGEIFELMPFENMMTVLGLTGVQVDSLAQQIAAARGEPIAGFTFKINEETGSAFDILVGDEPLQADKVYKLVTSDYLANGGGRFSAIWQPVNRKDLNMLLRDAYITYIRDTGTINPQVTGRISLGSL